MEVWSREKDRWSRTDTLWQALRLDDCLERAGKEKRPWVISTVGAGGKTSLIRRLAWEGKERGVRVLAATTTHMGRPRRFGVFSRSLTQVRKILDEESVAVAGALEEERKITLGPMDFFLQASALAQLVLVEADGSRRLPLKVPAAHEPVIPPNGDMILAVAGLSALGKPAGEVCFRLKQAELLAGLWKGRDWPPENPELDWVIQPEDLAGMIREGYVKPLSQAFPGMSTIPVFHQADSPALQEQARALAKACGDGPCLVSGGLLGDPSGQLF